MIATAQSIAAELSARDRRVVVLSDALPERNGVGTYYRDLVRQLERHVAHVELICPDRRSGWRGRFSFPMPGDGTQSICTPPLRRLSRHLRNLSPDVIISATPGPFGLLGMYFSFRHNARLFCGFHTHLEGLTDLYWQSGLSRLFGGFNRWYLNSAHKLMFRRSTAVIANSPGMADLARGLGARQVEMVGTPIPRRFLIEPLKPMSGQIGRVLFAGRLAPEKN
ncbi:MAG: glycosyltransferase, partial [Gammaproteobacteria bacterium]